MKTKSVFFALLFFTAFTAIAGDTTYLGYYLQPAQGASNLAHEQAAGYIEGTYTPSVISSNATTADYSTARESKIYADSLWLNYLNTTGATRGQLNRDDDGNPATIDRSIIAKIYRKGGAENWMVLTDETETREYYSLVKVDNQFTGGYAIHSRKPYPGEKRFDFVLNNIHYKGPSAMCGNPSPDQFGNSSSASSEKKNVVPQKYQQQIEQAIEAAKASGNTMPPIIIIAGNDNGNNNGGDCHCPAPSVTPTVTFSQPVQTQPQVVQLTPQAQQYVSAPQMQYVQQPCNTCNTMMVNPYSRGIYQATTATAVGSFVGPVLGAVTNWALNRWAGGNGGGYYQQPIPVNPQQQVPNFTPSVPGTNGLVATNVTPSFRTGTISTHW